MTPVRLSGKFPRSGARPLTLVINKRIRLYLVSVFGQGTGQNAERGGSAGRIRTVTIYGSIGPICGSVITVGLRFGLLLVLGLG